MSSDWIRSVQERATRTSRDLLREVYDFTMNKYPTPQKLAEDILGRSKCQVMVGAVIADRHGIFAWGWNNVGAGRGTHAERHAISRANPKRMRGASIYVAGERKRTGAPVEAAPCDDCMVAIRFYGIKRVYWRDKFGKWKMMYA